jgi:hypothetical protein
MHWRVAGTDLYLLGSVHVADGDLHFDPVIAAAIADATILAFEADFRLPHDHAVSSYSKSDRLSAHAPAELFADTRRMWVDFGLPEADLDHLRPWWVMLCLLNRVLEQRGFAGGVDGRVLASGVQAGKELFFLEPRMAGLEPFRAAPLAEQLKGLSIVVHETDEGVRDVHAIVDAWRTNRPQDLDALIPKFLGQMPRSYAAALAGRNKAWLPKILGLLRAGRPTVVTVGVLHMAGAGSLLELLARQGHECVLG